MGGQYAEANVEMMCEGDHIQLHFVMAYRNGKSAAAYLWCTIAGYGGHIAGKAAGNCIGGTYEKSNQDAVEHLKTTSQVLKYPATSAGV